MRNLVVHRAAILWVRMQDHCQRNRVRPGRHLKHSFESAGRSVKVEFFNCWGFRHDSCAWLAHAPHIAVIF